MNFGEAFAVGVAIGFCVSLLRITFGQYEISTSTVLVYSAVTFAGMAIILVLMPSPENNDALLSYITASSTGFTIMGGSLLGKYLAGYYSKR